MKLSPVFWPTGKEPKNADAQHPFNVSPPTKQRRGHRLRAARAWQQCHAEQDLWQTLRLRALNAVERVVRLGNSPR